MSLILRDTIRILRADPSTPLRFAQDNSSVRAQLLRAGSVAPNSSIKKVEVISNTELHFLSRCSNDLNLIDIFDQRESTVTGREWMKRELALKIVLALVGVLFVALVYPVVAFMRQEPALAMMMSLYVTLGIFLLLAIRRPAANRSLIAFTAWSSFAHAAVMGTQAWLNMVARGELIGVAVLVVIGVALIALAPAKQLPS
jgi:hypothetical protein